MVIVNRGSEESRAHTQSSMFDVQLRTNKRATTGSMVRRDCAEVKQTHNFTKAVPKDPIKSKVSW
jgi:hypothetical protein